ncbi:hypothetical protein LguiA_030099 [Lonicera macranthoides]
MHLCIVILFLNKFFFSSIEASRASPSSSALQSSSDLSKISLKAVWGQVLDRLDQRYSCNNWEKEIEEGSPSTEQIPQPLLEVIDKALPENGKFLQAVIIFLDAMAHLRASQPVESARSVESGDEVAQPKELEIMTQVLGSRSRHHKGYGSMQRLKVVGGSRATSSRGTYQDHEKDKVIATLKEQVTSQAE